MIEFKTALWGHRGRRSVVNVKRLLVAAITLFLVKQVLEFFFIINYNALNLTGDLQPRTRVSVAELINSHLRDDRKTFVPGFHRYNCGCDSFKFTQELHNSSLTTVSTCSFEASYESNQKVISYSLYLNDNDRDGTTQFLEGVEPNLQKIKELYPGWVVRIYSDIPTNNYSCNFICNYPHLFWCDISNIPKLGNLFDADMRSWRLLPLGDPTVSIFLSRDLDSLVSERERIAVMEWETSNQSIHVIRDSHWHYTEVLVGTFGFKNYHFSESELGVLQHKLVKKARKKNELSWDQDIVQQLIYLPCKDRVMAHDSYYCNEFPDGIVRPFSTRRIGEEFVGRDDRKEMNRLFIGRLKTCPKKCRPKHGKDWPYC